MGNHIDQGLSLTMEITATCTTIQIQMAKGQSECVKERYKIVQSHLILASDH